MYKQFLINKEDFLAAARRTYESGIQTGSGGNLSVRITGTELMIVKPSAISFGQCTEDNITITDFDGNLKYGNHKPTRESTLHGNIYKRYPDVGGIVHTHSPYSIAASLFYTKIDLVTMTAELKLGVPIPIVDVTTQSVTQGELPKVFKHLDAQPGLDAFILKKHGIVAMNATAVQAGQTAELIEETAQVFWEKQKMELLLSLQRTNM